MTTEMNENIIHPKSCYLIGTYYFPFYSVPQCHKCPKGYNKMNNCPLLLSVNKDE